jgi:type IV pilus assembly protein PilC
MALYTVRALTPTGRVRTRKEEAHSEDDLERRLSQDGFTLARIVRVDERAARVVGGSRVDKDALADFADRLHILYASGIPLVECLLEFESSSPSPRLRTIAGELRRGVERGEALSETMARFPGAFPPTFVAAIRAAERSGALDDVLRRLASQLEWERAALGVVKQALIYPAILSCAVLGLLTLLFTFLLPKIATFFQSSRAELPMPTQVVLAISDVLNGHGLQILGALIATAVILWLYRRTEGGRANLDRAALHLPFVGPILRKLACARFVATLRTLHHAGAPMLEALRSSKDASGNAAIARDLAAAVDRIGSGASLTDSIREVPDFDPIVVRMIRVGESSGSLSDSLEHATTMLDRDVQRRTKTLLAFIEPLLLIVSGVVVGFVVFATLLPIFRMLGDPR